MRTFQNSSKFSLCLNQLMTQLHRCQRLLTKETTIEETIGSPSSSKRRPPTRIAIFQPFLVIFLPSMFSTFKKNEVQTVILQCQLVLNLNWFKSYDTKCKYFHFWTWLNRKKIATDKCHNVWTN